MQWYKVRFGIGYSNYGIKGEVGGWGGGGMPTGQQLVWLTWQTRWVNIVYISAAGEELRQGIALSQ